MASGQDVRDGHPRQTSSVAGHVDALLAGTGGRKAPRGTENITEASGIVDQLAELSELRPSNLDTALEAWRATVGDLGKKSSVASRSSSSVSGAIEARRARPVRRQGVDAHRKRLEELTAAAEGVERQVLG